MKKLLLFGVMGAALVGSSGVALAALANTSQPTSAQWAFTRAGQHPEQLLESTMNNAHKTLDIAIYSITKYDIVGAIVAAKKRGVQVRVITDRSEAHNKSQAKELAYLRQSGIPIKENTHAGLMHMKVTVADGRVVDVGSYNYSTSASSTNDEILVSLRDSKMAQSFEQEFNQMWYDTQHYTNWSE